VEIYDCKLLYQKLLRRCEKELAVIRRRTGAELRLGILTVTTDEQNVAFASRVQAIAAGFGVRVDDERVAARNVGRKFIPILRDWAEDDSVQGIVLLYVPEENLPTLSEIYGLLPWEKDASGGHFHNVGHYSIEEKTQPGYPVPAEVAAVVEIINHYQIPARKRRVVIIGEGHTLERALMQRLCTMGCEVSFVKPEPDTAAIQSASGHAPKARIRVINRGGEVVVSCVNRPAYLTRGRLSRNCIVIDNGYNFYRGRIGGDVDYNSVQNWAKAITPVPGGVKSIAQAVTMLNYVHLLKLQYGLTGEDQKKDQITRRFMKVDKKLEANRSRL
jgi:methylenetetrahydrofolate dehydrogenase (NADP+)/methenyltetrahydrofolate cyclohydrolase